MKGRLRGLGFHVIVLERLFLRETFPEHRVDLLGRLFFPETFPDHRVDLLGRLGSRETFLEHHVDLLDRPLSRETFPEHREGHLGRLGFLETFPEHHVDLLDRFFSRETFPVCLYRPSDQVPFFEQAEGLVGTKRPPLRGEGRHRPFAWRSRGLEMCTGCMKGGGFGRRGVREGGEASA